MVGVNRKCGVKISVLSSIMAAYLSALAFLEVALHDSPVSLSLANWFFNIEWEFQYDRLTVSMLIPVTLISAIVNIYSMGYMVDPHISRFFSNLSLFTFFMVI
jgi:NADH-ubiquinone oxidoreductase chain 5